MTPEAQRIAISKACGWKRVTGESVQCPTYAFILLDPNKFQVAFTGSSVTALTKYLPDYLNDLNAMHEAEKVLTDGQKYIYTDNLWKLTHHAKIFPSVHATAAQRAEAFLRTIGKWENTAAKEGQL